MRAFARADPLQERDKGCHKLDSCRSSGCLSWVKVGLVLMKPPYLIHRLKIEPQQQKTEEPDNER